MVASYIALFKPRLALLVVFSAVLSYGIAVYLYPNICMNHWKLLYLILGGFLITGSANGFNQIIEIESDKKMDRTKNRPLPSETIPKIAATLFCIVTGVVGLYFLFTTNYLTCLLGFLSWASYVLVYTPLKKISSVAVWVGAIPGALPYLMGFTAVTEELNLFAWLLFSIQFFWQFPHFWAIAWVLDEDYQKGGFRLLPSKGGKDAITTFQILLYTIVLLIFSITPYIYVYKPENNVIISIGFVTTLLAGIAFLYKAFQLQYAKTDATAKGLMFASFIYLPVVQLILLAVVMCME